MADSAAAGACPPARADSDCPFCRPAVQARPVAACNTVLAIQDAHPAAPGHLLVITRRHTPDFFTMTPAEQGDALKLLADLRDRALRDDPAITGFNVGANCGESAGQRIMHAHIHFIPRRDDDPNRPGGAKGVIRNRMSY